MFQLFVLVFVWQVRERERESNTKRKEKGDGDFVLKKGHATSKMVSPGVKAS